ncbi:MAG: class I SAM-dependent methyltransferase [Gammaproteobacteria bacterium]
MKLFFQTLVMAALYVAVGCQSEAPPPAPEQAPTGESAAAPSLDPDIGRAILANPIRTQEARDRDPRSKPEVILSLLDLKPGDRAIDIFGGSGYYTDLMAGMVGETGEVILYNNSPFHTFVEERVQPRYIDDPIPGIRYLKSEVDDLQLEPESLDAALIVMAYHDLYYFNPGVGFGEVDVPLFFAQIHAALKAGGKLLIVDHAAKAGSGKEAAQHLHRIDEEFAIQDIESHGFKLVETSDALRNPEDDRQKMVFDAEFRGRTDRFILLFEKQ